MNSFWFKFKREIERRFFCAFPFANTRTTVHEFGHLFGLEHSEGISNAFNIMMQGGFGWGSDQAQRGSIISNLDQGNLNKGGAPYLNIKGLRSINTVLLYENIRMQMGRVGLSVDQNKARRK